MSIAEVVVNEARRWIGTPYRHAGSRWQVGCDCLGLVRGVWRAIYGSEPQPIAPYSADWGETGYGDPLLEAARRHFAEKPHWEIAAGDLVAFRWRDGVAAKHVGIVTGAQRFIHAYEGHAVVESALVPQWRRRIAGVFAFPDIIER